MASEEWKDIKFKDTDGKEYDFTGRYQVSSYGRIRSLNFGGRKGKIGILKEHFSKDGYVVMHFRWEGKRKNFRVHRLVAHMFIPNPDNLPIVNHRDECKSNNHIDNLEWCTYKYNSNYSLRPCSEEARAKMSEAQKGKQKTSETKQKMSMSKKGNKNYNARKVICIETKEIFNTMDEASKWCHGNVNRCCSGERKTAGGYHWAYYEDYIVDLKKQTDCKNITME